MHFPLLFIILHYSPSRERWERFLMKKTVSALSRRKDPEQEGQRTSRTILIPRSDWSSIARGRASQSSCQLGALRRSVSVSATSPTRSKFTRK